MQKRLAYGNGRAIDITIDDAKLVACRGGKSGSGSNVTDVTATAQQAISQPRSFPPLSSCLVPGDRIAIAVAEETPQVVPVVRGAIAAFVAAGVEPRLITVVTQTKQDAALLDEAVSAAGGQLATHDPDDQAQLCFAGATHDGRPLMINRHVFEAEMVLPISPTLPSSQEKPASVFCGIFPAFSDSPTKQRLAGAACFTPEACEEIDEAGWLLGVILVAQVATEAGQLSALIVGPPPEVAPAIREAGQSGQQEYAGKASLVIATLTGSAADQSWKNIGQALAQAEQLRLPDEAIALCSDIAEPLSDDVTAMIAQGEVDLWLEQIEQSSPEEAKYIRQLSRAIDRGPVYLMSNLDPDWVEELGFAPVATATELNRLVSRHESVAIIESAHTAAVCVAEVQTVRPESSVSH